MRERGAEKGENKGIIFYLFLNYPYGGLCTALALTDTHTVSYPPCSSFQRILAKRVRKAVQVPSFVLFAGEGLAQTLSTHQSKPFSLWAGESNPAHKLAERAQRRRASRNSLHEHSLSK